MIRRRKLRIGVLRLTSRVVRPGRILKGREGISDELGCATSKKMGGEIKAGWENFVTARAIKHGLSR
jgi:hypothetical protein